MNELLGKTFIKATLSQDNTHLHIKTKEGHFYYMAPRGWEFNDIILTRHRESNRRKIIKEVTVWPRLNEVRLILSLWEMIVVQLVEIQARALPIRIEV